MAKATTAPSRRALIEIAVAYVLILLVVWTPRPWQFLLWWIASITILLLAIFSFNGPGSLGLRAANLLRSLWIVAAALLLAALALLLAAQLHTLRLPASPVLFVRKFWAYALWAAVQQLLLQCFFLSRLLRVLSKPWQAALAATILFALAHVPSPLLVSLTLIWGFASCLLFLRYRNLYPLMIAHAIFGIAIALTVPGPIDHNMRVGLGYLTYGHERTHHRSHSDQIASTVACVTADAPTLRSLLHARP